MSTFKEFLSLFYYRIQWCRFLRYIASGRESLYIATKNIGNNFFIEHGFSTIISAKAIGDNFWVNQQVTIGYNKGGNPIIGDNVRVGAGAIIIGNIQVGNNCIIGAGAVVTKSVPDNSVIVGNPAFILKQNGNKVNKKL